MKIISTITISIETKATSITSITIITTDTAIPGTDATIGGRLCMRGIVLTTATTTAGTATPGMIPAMLIPAGQVHLVSITAAHGIMDGEVLTTTGTALILHLILIMVMVQGSDTVLAGIGIIIMVTRIQLLS